jgi:hypothetical protein
MLATPIPFLFDIFRSHWLGKVSDSSEDTEQPDLPVSSYSLPSLPGSSTLHWLRSVINRGLEQKFRGMHATGHNYLHGVCYVQISKYIKITSFLYVYLNKKNASLRRLPWVIEALEDN